MSNPTFKQLMNITWGYLNNTLRFIFYYPLALDLLVRFKFKVTHEKPIMKIQEDQFREHFLTTAPILKTVWLKRQPPDVFRKKKTKNWCSWEFQKFPEKSLCWSLFLMKLPALGPESLLKRDSGAGAFLWDWGNSC